MSQYWLATLLRATRPRRRYSRRSTSAAGIHPRWCIPTLVVQRRYKGCGRCCLPVVRSCSSAAAGPVKAVRPAAAPAGAGALALGGQWVSAACTSRIGISTWTLSCPGPRCARGAAPSSGSVGSVCDAPAVGGGVHGRDPGGAEPVRRDSGAPEINFATTPALITHLAEALAVGGIVVDYSEVSFCDSTALKVLINAAAMRERSTSTSKSRIRRGAAARRRDSRGVRPVGTAGAPRHGRRPGVAWRGVKTTGRQVASTTQGPPKANWPSVSNCPRCA